MERVAVAAPTHRQLVLVDELPDELEQEIAPGKFAVVAEIWDEWNTAIDARMESLGGRLVCEWWREFGEDLLAEHTRRDAELETRRTLRKAAGRSGLRRS